jgi:2-polyprenyl-6-methoxyphenol hydroxylase-like FAD-dependent oxidoreductase
MMTKPHALVIGGSVGGLIAGSLFRTVGWNATVFERTVGDLTGRGAGLGISAELLAVMKRIGAKFEPSAGVAHESYVWMEADGQIVFEHHRKTVGSAWARVYQPLRDAVPAEIYRQGMTFERVEQDASSVTAVFSDGSRVTGDILVAADGVLSTVRRQFMPEVEPRYANYVAWRGLADERDVSRAAIDAIAGHLVYGFPAGEMILTMPVPGEGEDMRPGHRRIYFIWYIPVSRAALTDMFTDATGKNHGVSIPPPLIRAELVRNLRAHASDVLAPPIAEVVHKVKQPLLQAITDMESPRLTFGRVALMGDAAFVARPHVAGGVSKAALDAQCLVDSLAAANGDIAAGLARYDRAQQAFGARIVAHSRYLGAYLEGQVKPPAERKGHEVERDPRQLIRDYGAPNMLHDVDPAGFRAGLRGAAAR